MAIEFLWYIKSKFTKNAQNILPKLVHAWTRLIVGQRVLGLYLENGTQRCVDKNISNPFGVQNSLLNFVKEF